MGSSIQTLSLSRRLLAVFVGGFCGTILRVLLSIWIVGWLGKAWPFDTLVINLTGAFLFAFVTMLAQATLWIGPTRRLLLTTGFLGAYTTFSSLALGDVSLLTWNHWLPALGYLLASGVGGILAILGGAQLGQWWVQCVRQRTSVLIPQTQKEERRTSPSSLLKLPSCSVRYLKQKNEQEG
jgi:fluoride exporter